MTKEQHDFNTNIDDIRIEQLPDVRKPLVSSGVIGWVLEAVHAPGLIKPFIYRDSNNEVSVRTSQRYTILLVNGLELFFYRENGGFDGFGRLAISSGCRVGGILQSELTPEPAAAPLSESIQPGR